METKDLVLLMMIPVILIGMIAYTNNAPTIIGAATGQQQEESNILGTYSIMPSFKAKIDYDLNEYNFIRGKLSEIVDSCSNAENIGQCLKNNAKEWNCGISNEEASNILYDFLDKFNECLNLQEDGVVCRFSLDEMEVIRGSNPTSIFYVKLTNENARTKAQLISGTKTLPPEYIDMQNLVYTDYGNRDTLSKNLDSVSFTIDYSGGKPFIEDAFGSNSDSPRIGLSKRAFLLYKKDNYVKFIDANTDSSFEAPNPANKIIDLPRINGVKLCVKSPSNKQAYAYDKIDNTIALRDVVYRFAVTYPK